MGGTHTHSPVACSRDLVGCEKYLRANFSTFARAICSVLLDSMTVERYSMYKLGSLICVNHGMGAPSLSILMHEVFKLLSYAKATNVTILRVGTSGGLGVEPGTVIVSSGALNSALEPVYTQHVLGRAVNHPTAADSDVAETIVKSNSNATSLNVISGLTMSCNDFYEEQARLDGYFCDHTAQQRADFLRHCHQVGVRNIEMEAAAFLAFCYRAKIKAAVVCVALVDRLQGDQVTSTSEKLTLYSSNCITAVFNYIKQQQ